MGHKRETEAEGQTDVAGCSASSCHVEEFSVSGHDVEVRGRSKVYVERWR